MEQRDLAIVEMLASTGMRVGEMVLLNRQDIDFENRESIVFGKGDKERVVYFDARTKKHLMEYLASRNDDNEALFVTLRAPFNRIQIGGIERSLATMAIDRGMPIEQLQKLLGHQRIDTTLQYAMDKEKNMAKVKLGEIADITKLAGFEFTKYIKYNDTGEIIALRALNLRNGQLDLSDIKRIDRNVSDNLVRSRLYKGDILLTYTGNGYGDCALIEENDKYHLAPNICKITPDTTKAINVKLCNRKWTAYYTNENYKDIRG
ncbi:unnamed protein product [Cylicostephanus goldi]|uniref:Tyr recombinase domain-containing protein n=1 Tax=Cylicostephanus goldi TaxID=71465 RepID=A0A3P7MI67_CYLGO|nr:unnamed protein product [Cylicostephanus goldi]